MNRIEITQTPTKAMSNPASRQVEREKLNNDIEEFLKNGGAVKHIEGFVASKPKEPCKTKPQKKWREKRPEKRVLMNHLLKEWCITSSSNRAKNLARVLNKPNSYIANRIDGGCFIHKNEYYNVFLPAMNEVERNERI